MKADRLYTTGRVLLFCLCCVIILVASSGLTKNTDPRFKDHLSILAATLLTFFTILLFLKWEKRNLSSVGLQPGKYSIARFSAGYIAGLALAALQVLIVMSHGHLQLILVPDIRLGNLVSPLVLYFLVACREELAFRSYSLRRLNIEFGPAVALTVIGIIFIVEHVAGVMSWRMAILGSGMGAVLFGVAALKTKGIALSLGLHSAWNFGQWTFGFKNTAGV